MLKFVQGSQCSGKTVKLCYSNWIVAVIVFDDETYTSFDCGDEGAMTNYELSWDDSDALHSGIISQEEQDKLRREWKEQDRIQKESERFLKYEELKREFEPPAM